MIFVNPDKDLPILVDTIFALKKLIQDKFMGLRANDKFSLE